jgi:hypothetical protein
MPAVTWGSRDRVLFTFGLATCAYWLMRAFLPSPILPFTSMPDFGPLLSGVAPWIREMSPELRKPDVEIIAQLRHEIIVATVRAWVLIVAGMAAGALIAARKPTGRWLALVLAVLVLTLAGAGEWEIAAHDGKGYLQFWRTKFEILPLYAVRQLLDVAFCAFSVVFLTRRAMAQRFRR